MRTAHRGARLDERRDQDAGAREARARSRNKIGYPDKWRDYSTLAGQARRLLRQRRRAPTGFETQAPAGEDRQAGRSRRVGDDAADRQRLLQPADERHQLPGRRAAAAALRPEDGRRAELRQHRRAPSATS